MLSGVMTHTHWVCQAYYPMVRVKTSKAKREGLTGQETAHGLGPVGEAQTEI